MVTLQAGIGRAQRRLVELSGGRGTTPLLRVLFVCGLFERASLCATSAGIIGCWRSSPLIFMGDGVLVDEMRLVEQVAEAVRVACLQIGVHTVDKEIAQS